MEGNFIYFIETKRLESKKNNKTYYVLNYLNGRTLRYYTQFISQDFYDDIIDSEYELFAELHADYEIDFDNHARIKSLTR